MRLTAKDGMRGQVIDLDTGKAVRKVIWLDIELGQLMAYQLTDEGTIRHDPDGSPMTYHAKGRFKFIPRTVPVPLGMPAVGAPRCARCGHGVTLPASELCAFCHAYNKGHRRFTARELPVQAMFAARPCEFPGCGRQAFWQVSDEVEASPELGPVTRHGKEGKAYFLRGTTVARRNWCAWHYQPPRLLDPRGEVIQELDGVRP